MNLMYRKIINQLDKQIAYLIFAIASLATLGSLGFSEVANFIPCKLCWYQRIALFPIAVISAVDLVRGKLNFAVYALTLSIIGGVIAFYQNLLQWGVIEESVLSCDVFASCADKYINWLGFITIPLLSLVTFIVLGLLSARLVKLSNQD